MRKHKEQTVNLVQLLTRHPVIVADIFEYGASGMLVPNIVEAVTEFWGSDFERTNTKLTEHYVWAMFHRRRPFHDARLYSQVKQENQEKVSARLYSTDPKFSLSEPNSATCLAMAVEESEDEIRERLSPYTDRRKRLMLLTRVLSARTDYEDAMQAARDAGMSIDSILEWIDVPLEVDE